MRRSARSGANNGQPGPFGIDHDGTTTGPFAMRNQSLGKFEKLKTSGDVFGPQHRGLMHWLRGGSCGESCCDGGGWA